MNDRTNHASRPADRYDALPTAAVSDALDRLGLPGSLHGIGPLRRGQRAVGPAYTVAYEPVDDQAGTVGDFLDEIEAGSVVIMANDGRTDCTCGAASCPGSPRTAASPPPSSTASAGTSRPPVVSTTPSGAPAGSCAH